MPIKIILADDQPLVRRGLKSLLQEEGFVIVGECGEGRLVSQLAEEQRPHLVILDFYLPDISGVEVCNRLVRKLPAIKTLILTGCRHVPTLARLVRSPATGIMTKDADYSLTEAIQTICRGKTYIQPDIARQVMAYINEKHTLDTLSDREYLLLLMHLQGQTNEQIAAHLNLSAKTVNNVKWEALKKLGAPQRGDLYQLFFRTT